MSIWDTLTPQPQSGASSIWDKLYTAPNTANALPSSPALGQFQTALNPPAPAQNFAAPISQSSPQTVAPGSVPSAFPLDEIGPALTESRNALYHPIQTAQAIGQSFQQGNIAPLQKTLTAPENQVNPSLGLTTKSGKVIVPEAIAGLAMGAEGGSGFENTAAGRAAFQGQVSDNVAKALDGWKPPVSLAENVGPNADNIFRLSQLKDISATGKGLTATQTQEAVGLLRQMKIAEPVPNVAPPTVPVRNAENTQLAGSKPNPLLNFLNTIKTQGKRGFINLGADMSEAKPLETPPPETTLEAVSSPKDTTVNPRINPDNLNISPEAKATLESISQDLSPKTAAKVGDTMTNKEVVDFAKANPNLTQNAVSRDASLKANAAMLQARQTLAAQMESLSKGTASVADKEAIIKNFLAVKSTATDLGRSLQKMGVGASPSESSTVSDIIAKIAKTGASVDDIVAAAKNVDFSNYNQVVSFYRQFVKPTAGDWIDLVRYNSMLSSPLTLSNISAGNAVNIAMQPIVKSTAGAIDWIKTGIVGGKQTHFIGEGPAYVVGAAKNISTAFSKFTDVITGKLDPKMLDFNIPIAAEGKAGLFTKSMNIFSTLHNAMYQFFNTIAKGGSEASLAYKGEAGPLSELTAQSEADYATFRAGTNPEGQGDVLNGIDTVANLVKQMATQDKSLTAKWLAKFTLPFIRISTNMAKQMIEYSPAGFTTVWRAGDPITQLAKASIGTAAFTTIGMMAVSGNITGAAPTVPADKTAFAASGRQAYSIKIGNTWFSYNKLPPALSIPMLLSASYMQSQATGIGKDKMQSVLDAFGSFGKYVADQSYVKNIGDLVSAMQGDTTKGNPLQTLITNDAQQLVPFRAFSGWLAKLLDPYQRQIDTSQGAIQTEIQALMEQIPGLRQQVPMKVDAAGNPIPNQNRVTNAVSPVQVSQTTPQQDQTYQDYNTIKGLNAQQTISSKDLTVQAQTLYDHLKTLPKDDANAQALALKTSNPQLFAKLKTIVTAAKLNRTADEKKMLTLGTTSGERAQFIFSKLQQLSTSTEKNAYVKELQDKKIITSTVFGQLKKIIANPSKAISPPASTKSLGLGGRISAYFSAITTNPVQAFHDIFHGQTISGTKNGAVTVDRMSLAQSESIKKSLLPAGANAADYQLDHIIPLELGGTNERSNLQLLTKAQDDANTSIENLVGNALGDKKISASAAVKLMLQYKQGTVTAEQVIQQLTP